MKDVLKETADFLTQLAELLETYGATIDFSYGPVNDGELTLNVGGDEIAMPNDEITPKQLLEERKFYTNETD